MINKKNKMSVMQLTILTATNMMGSGIIMLPAQLAKVGTMSILSWIITAGGAIALAYAFSRCSMFSNKSGGMGGYAEYTFGKNGNFLSNYAYGLSLLIANVAIAITVVGYFSECIEASFTPIQVGLGTILVLWLATILNFGGAKNTGKINAFTILGALLPIGFICIFGWFWFDPNMYITSWNPRNLPWFEGISMSISMTLWAFLGLESACANSNSVENPEKNVPIAVMGGTIGAAIIYILSTNIIAGIVPNANLLASTGPFGLAFGQMLGGVAGKTVMMLMVVSCFGSLLGWQFTIAHVFRSSALAGFFPKFFEKSNFSEVPILGMVVITFIQTGLALMTISPTLSKQFNILVDLAVVTNIIPYILAMFAVNEIQKKALSFDKFAKFGNIAAIFAITYSFYALYAAGVEALIYGFIMIIAGWAFYGIKIYHVNQRKKEHVKIYKTHV